MLNKDIVLSMAVIAALISCGKAQDSSQGIYYPADFTKHHSSTSDWLLDSDDFKAVGITGGSKNRVVLTNGLVQRTIQTVPNAATIGIRQLVTGQSVLRAVRPEATVWIEGKKYDVGGLMGQPNLAYLTEDWLSSMKRDPKAFRFARLKLQKPKARFPWARVRHHAPDANWPPKGVSLQIDFEHDELTDVLVSVHYEIYDGVPVLCKWLSVTNNTDETIVVDRFTVESLAVVEHSNWVEARDGVDLPAPDSIHVETDFAFGGFNHHNANRHVVRWKTDPKFTTQVNYLKQTPCVLEVSPTYGPAQDVRPGETFESFRTFELFYDSTDRDRRGLTLKRMYRTIAPWITENPLMMHLKTSKPEAVRTAIEQCAEVGFEMLILSFGSGFNIENKSNEYVRQWKELGDYAKSKNVEIGGYSLLSSRRIGRGNDIVSPEGVKPTHGNCPALTSQWGQDYFANLYSFFDATGFKLLEHDGSYPGDVDVTARPPLQKGIEDSRWAQWKIISTFYQWCREHGVYLNVPDYYYLAGANKCGMGYREVNWSLPRDQQIIHTRQNIFDGTWTKTPSMGWMFVPLTQYHGGGAAATVEPLHEHLDHYENMIACNLGAGVQACYRGPRLFDTPQTKAAVKKWVDWYKKYRDILESDIIHNSSRRADGRDIDWVLHANSQLKHRGFLAVYNPLSSDVERKVTLDLYYTGLTESVKVTDASSQEKTYPLDRRFRVTLPVKVPAKGMSWYVLE